MDNRQQQIIDWYNENWNMRLLPFFKKPVITPDTSLSTGNYPWVREDAEEILCHYFTFFNVERRGFTLALYWPNEEVFMPLNILRAENRKWKWKQPKPLTLKMLAESASAGYWLYD
ncbi:DUF1493 family protein [Tatumella saanichensis]|uniref:DUF1493 family protein n=1 Tax=Tatumella saanichensis TaxID=480813 RepID=UPI0004A44CDE|nr:DUF1493 family protein [Tatumella saanichensis]